MKMSELETSLEQLETELTASENTENTEAESEAATQEGIDPQPEGEDGNRNDGDPPAQPEGGYQKRINRLTAEKYELRRQLQELKQKATPEAAQQAVEPQAPTLEQFDYDEEKYREALIDYKVDKKLRKNFSRMESEQAQRSVQERQEAAARDFARKVEKANLPNYADAVETLSRSIVLPPEAISAIQTLENGPDVVVYLSENLDKADAMIRKGAIGAAVEIGMIGARLSVNTRKPSKPTNAPAPIQPVKGGGAVNKKLEDMSMQEIYALDD